MIVLVNLQCPNGHDVCGTPHEYASEQPPQAWYEQIGLDCYRETRDETRCPFCGAERDADESGWRISIHQMKAKTMEEARAILKTVASEN